MSSVRQVEIDKDYITLNFHKFGSGEPKFFLVSGIHGDEATGIFAAWNLIEKLKGRKVSGTITILPLANPLAYRFRARTANIVECYSNPDLNRLFPGNADGNILERIANDIWRVASDSNYIIDLHCCMPDSYPFMPVNYEKNDIRNLVQKFPTNALVISRGPALAPGTSKGSLEGIAVDRDIPAIIVEVRGGNGQMNLEDAKMLSDSIMKLFVNLDFLEGEKTEVEHEVYGPLTRIRSEHDGFFIQKVSPGTKTTSDTVLGEIHNVGPIKAPHKGIVTHIVPSGVIFKGDLLSWVPKEL